MILPTLRLRTASARFSRRCSGQSTVEFVLLFPMVLVMALALAEFGFMLHANLTVKSAAREAARYAAVANLPSSTPGTCDLNSIEDRAVDAASNLVTCPEITVGYIEQTFDTEYGRGDEVVVNIDHGYALRTPLGDLLGALSFGAIPSTVQIRACADARLEIEPTDQSVLLAGAGDCGP